MEKVSFTIIKAQNVVSKTLSLNNKGKVETKEGGAMTHGTSFTYETDSLNALVDYINSTKDGQHYLCLGTSEHEQMDVTISDLLSGYEEGSAIARTKRFFSFRQNPGFLFIDYDPKPESEITCTKEQLLQILYDAAPCLKTTPHLWKTSSGSCIFNGNTQITGVGGQHVFFALKDSRDIPRVASTLFTRLWLNGHGFIGLTASGAKKKYTVMDGVVNSPERPVFLAAATVPPLNQRAELDTFNTNESCLDSVVEIPDLSRSELTAYNQLIQQKKSNVALDKKSKKLKRESVQRVIKRTGLSEQEVNQMMKSSNVYGAFVLTLRDGSNITVAEILRDKAKYQGVRCADPFDPQSYGGKLDIAWLNVNTAVPCVWSHAHGGKLYYLHTNKHEAETERVQYTAEVYHDYDTRDIQLAKYSLAEIASALININPDSDVIKIAGALWELGDESSYDLFCDWLKTRDIKDNVLIRKYWAEGRTAKHPVAYIFKKAREGQWRGIESEFLNPLVRKYINKDIQNKLKILTDTYSICMQEGKYHIIYKQFSTNLEQWETQFTTGTELKPFHRSDTVYVIETKAGTGEEILKKKEIFNLWDSCDNKRQYNQVYFSPRGGIISGRSEKRNIEFTRKGVVPSYNLYQGLAVVPTPDGEEVTKYGYGGNTFVQSKGCDLVKQHIYEVWCSGNKELYEYVINWFARLFQDPDETGQTALVLRSGQGSGKNVIANPLVRAFGSHGTIVTDSNDFLGRFNSNIAKSCLVVLNEAVWGGSAKSQQGKLKALITDDTLRFEEKFIRAAPLKNCAHLMIMTNSDWAVPVDIGDRRFVFLDVSMCRVGDTAYFTELRKQIKNGGLENFVYFLLNRDISAYNVSKIPTYHSDVRIENKLETAHAYIEWWFECVIFNKLYADPKDRKLANSTMSLYDIGESYIEWCARHQYKNRIETRKAIRFIKFDILSPKLKKGKTPYTTFLDSDRAIKMPDHDTLLAKCSTFFGDDITKLGLD